MVLITILKEIDPSKSEVISIHFCPMDETHGLGLTIPQLSEIGILVDDYTEPEIKEGYAPVMYYNPQTGKIFYEYIDNPVIPVEEQKEDPVSTEDIIAEATKPLEDKLNETEKENETLKALLKMKGIEI